MVGYRGYGPVNQFGDIDVTVLLDMSVPLTGLETVTAQGIQRLIDLPGSGTCSVALQRLGIDAEPKRVTRVVPSNLSKVTGPMRWVNWWQHVPEGPRHVVLLVVHELRDTGYVHRPKTLRLLPLALAVGVAADLVAKLSFIPATHVLHTPIEQLARGWEAVADGISRVRSIPNMKDPRIMRRLAFTGQEQLEMTPKQPDMAYARKIGCLGEFVRNRQRHSALPHVR